MKKEYRELRRRPLLTPLWMLALVGVGLVVAVAIFVASMTTTTVVVVRHAESELGTIDDPPLSLAGEQRVQLLARTFGDRGEVGRLAAVFADGTRRSHSTAAPLAARLGLSVTVIAEVDRLLRRIQEDYRGENVLIVARPQTQAQIVKRLSGVDGISSGVDGNHSTGYVVTVPTLGRPSLLRFTY